MDLERIENLLRMLTEHDVGEFSYEDSEYKLKIRLGALPLAPVAQMAPAPVAAPPSLVGPRLEAVPKAGSNDGLYVVESPMVGTFYRATSPGAAHFVEVGDRVPKGKVLCIVEAMKLMNEIEAEVAGEVVEICAENGHAVQFGQPLVKIRPL